MKAKLRENQLWTGIAFILLGVLLWVVGWDRVTFPTIGEVNVDLMCMSVGIVCAVSGFYQKKKQ